MINDFNLAYIAGFLDGDGCFNIREEQLKTRKKYPSQLIVTSTDIEIMYFFKQIIGGNFSKVNELRPNRKPSYRWTLCGKAAADLAEQLLPFLVEKVDQAKLFIEFTRTNDKSLKALLCNQMKQIKHAEHLINQSDIDIFKSLKNTIKYTEQDIAYFAGFIDAECCFTLGRYRAARTMNWIYKANIACGNTKFPCFIFLASRFGGSITFVKKIDSNHRHQILWRMSSTLLKEILPKLKPYLQIKSLVCQELINFYNLTLKNGGARHTDIFRDAYQANLLKRDEIFHRVKVLNTRVKS